MAEDFPFGGGPFGGGPFGPGFPDNVADFRQRIGLEARLERGRTMRARRARTTSVRGIHARVVVMRANTKVIP